MGPGTGTIITMTLYGSSSCRSKDKETKTETKLDIPVNKEVIFFFVGMNYTTQVEKIHPDLTAQHIIEPS